MKNLVHLKPKPKLEPQSLRQELEQQAEEEGINHTGDISDIDLARLLQTEHDDEIGDLLQEYPNRTAEIIQIKK